MEAWAERASAAWRKQFAYRVCGAKTEKLVKWLDGVRRTLPLWEQQPNDQRGMRTGLTVVEEFREQLAMIEAELERRERTCIAPSEFPKWRTSGQ